MGTAPSREEAAKALQLESGVESKGCAGEQDAAHLEVKAVFGEHAPLGKPYKSTSDHASQQTRLMRNGYGQEVGRIETEAEHMAGGRAPEKSTSY